MIRGRTCVVLVSAAFWACGGDDSTPPLAPSSATTAVRPARASTLSEAAASTLLSDLGTSSNPNLFVCHGNGAVHSGSATIGTLGGVIHIGPHTLTVPPMALLQPVTITATTIPGDTIAVVFGPQGQKFLLPPTLTLDYSHCQNAPGDPLTVDLLDNALGTVLDLLPSTDEGKGKVTAPIWHFSIYAAAETRKKA